MNCAWLMGRLSELAAGMFFAPLLDCCRCLDGSAGFVVGMVRKGR